MIPVPAEVTPASSQPVAESVAAPWLAALEKLEDDEVFWQGESETAKVAAQRYLPEILTARYREFFLSC